MKKNKKLFAVLAALEISDEYSKLKKDYEDMVKLFEEK